MDKGAHFYKSDFQVHTPRDINWHGTNAVSDAKRKEYAESLVWACRGKGINAIAVTDHHDFTFFPHIKRAALMELDDDGDIIPKYQQLTVFPGLELTLSSPPCQALLILDSNFPENLLPGVLSSLGITASAETESKTADVVAIVPDVAKDFIQLYERLGSLDYVKGRFTIFPHVGDGGYKTLLRSGFHGYYRTMPCVGGYIESPISRIGQGNMSIINGKNREYGFKEIALIQTSDNRKANHKDLGKYTTWIKWAEPTAEALRQACLAKESRISQEEPILPPVYITSLDVSNSKFLGRVYLEFNRQYNAIIGGRGTGKSTLLEYLRWGLCDQCPELSHEDYELPNYQDRRKKLIEKTLLPYNSTVQVSFIKNDIPHVVRRKAKSSEISIKIGNSEFETCTEENVRNLLPIQAYSQKQLSSVSVSNTELKRLVYSPIRQSLADFTLSFKNLQTDIRTCYEKRGQAKSLQNEIHRNELELKSIVEQVENLRKNLKGISEEDRTAIESHEKYSIAEQIIENLQSELSSAVDAVDNLITEFQNLPSPIPEDSSLPAEIEATIKSIGEIAVSFFSSAKKVLAKIRTQFEKPAEEEPQYAQDIAKWEKALAKHKQAYQLAKKRSSSHQVILTQIGQLEERAKEIRKSFSEKNQLLNRLGDQEQTFQNLKTQWVDTHKNRADLIEKQCEQLSVLSDNNLRAKLGRGEGVDELHSTLKGLITGANIRKEKTESICTSVSRAISPVVEWHEILDELEKLAVFDIENDALEKFPNTPKLTVLGFSTNDLRKIAEKLTTNNFVDLYLVQLEDIPVFEYMTREGEYMEFIDASAGQQATALIHVLLNQEGPPLIIDQPEDDLDNQMISEIAELVCKSKKNRQLVFTSHNANIVVNGDSELVACCDYRVSGDQSNGEINAIGAIDIAELREKITKIMEGGEKAFRLRKEKYGF